MISINESNFQEITKSDKPVLVDFYADWCGPCRALTPLFKKWDETHGEKAIFGKINIDDEFQLAAKFSVNSIPTVILFKDGKETKRWVGIPPEIQILEELN